MKSIRARGIVIGCLRARIEVGRGGRDRMLRIRGMCCVCLFVSWLVGGEDAVRD